MTSVRKLFLVVVLAFVSTPAKADDTHYQDFLVGGRAIGLGGAFAAISDDSSGAYYNPAGIVDSQTSNVSLATSLYGFERGVIGSSGFGDTGVSTDLNTTATNLIVVPASAGSVKHLGDKDELGRARHALALSVMVPSFRTSSPFATRDSDEVGTARQTYRQNYTDRSLWAGIGYANRMSSRLRLGASAYYVLRSLNDSEQLTNSANGGALATFDMVQSNVSVSVSSLLFQVGAKYDLAPNWLLGVSLSSPSIRLMSSAQVSYVHGISDPANGVSTVQALNPSGLRAQSNIPAGARLGIARHVDKSYTVSADLSGHLGTSYDLVTNIPNGSGLETLLPFPTAIHRRPVLNLNLGGEYYFSPDWSVSAGAFTDFSSADKIPAAPLAVQSPDVDLYGLTASLAWSSEHTENRLGASYSFGTGKTVTPTSDIARLTQESQSFARQTYSQSFFYVFLASSFKY